MFIIVLYLNPRLHRLSEVFSPTALNPTQPLVCCFHWIILFSFLPLHCKFVCNLTSSLLSNIIFCIRHLNILDVSVYFVIQSLNPIVLFNHICCLNLTLGNFHFILHSSSDFFLSVPYSKNALPLKYINPFTSSHWLPYSVLFPFSLLCFKA